METRKELVSINPKYCVSNTGKVRSPFRIMKGNFIKVNKDGRHYISYMIDGKRYLAHRLVAHAFLGIDLKSGMCVCHKNDNPEDNNVENLFIGTYKDNTHDMVKKGRGLKKLNILDIQSIIRMYDKGKPYSTRRLGRIYGVSSMTIIKILKQRHLY